VFLVLRSVPISRHRMAFMVTIRVAELLKICIVFHRSNTWRVLHLTRNMDVLPRLYVVLCRWRPCNGQFLIPGSYRMSKNKSHKSGKQETEIACSAVCLVYNTLVWEWMTQWVRESHCSFMTAIVTELFFLYDIHSEAEETVEHERVLRQEGSLQHNTKQADRSTSTFVLHAWL
jgi:hypothetical protein